MYHMCMCPADKVDNPGHLLIPWCLDLSDKRGGPQWGGIWQGGGITQGAGFILGSRHEQDKATLDCNKLRGHRALILCCLGSLR